MGVCAQGEGEAAAAGCRLQAWEPGRTHQPCREFGRRAQFAEDGLAVISEMLQRCGNVVFTSRVGRTERRSRTEASRLSFFLFFQLNCSKNIHLTILTLPTLTQCYLEPPCISRWGRGWGKGRLAAAQSCRRPPERTCRAGPVGQVFTRSRVEGGRARAPAHPLHPPRQALPETDPRRGKPRGKEGRTERV